MSRKIPAHGVKNGKGITLKTKPQKPFKTHFIQNWGTYSNDTLVCVNYTYDDIAKVFRKKGVDKEWSKAWESPGHRERANNWLSESKGAMWTCNGRTVLWLKEFTGSWQNFDTIVHELAHAVHYVLGHNRNMMDEDEARAYQQEYLFREIRDKITSAYAKYNKTTLLK